MFTEKIKTWKQITAGFAIFGFILSFITGLIGTVGVGVVILRAFVFAALFGGISMLIMYLIDTFIPELINPDVDEDADLYDSAEIAEDNERSSEDSGSLSGGKLDITIEDDDVADEASSVLEFEEIESAEEAVAVEELEEVQAADSDVSLTPGEAVEASSGGDMPDIGEFSDSFNAADLTGSSEGLSSIDGMGSSTGAEIMGDMHDTQDLVKAVQTVLKKDQEG